MSAKISKEDTDRSKSGRFLLAALERQGPHVASLLGVLATPHRREDDPDPGFLGTVVGMIAAFAAIEAAGEVEATVVASGIKIALITTAAIVIGLCGWSGVGLILAIALLSALLRRWMQRRLDGMTGDTAGALIEVTEAGGLAALALIAA